MQDKSKAKHKYSRSTPEGLYSGKDKKYVYGDNTVRKSYNVYKVLFYLLPVIMVAVFAVGFSLGYVDYKEKTSRNGSSSTPNEDYINPDDEVQLYKIVSIANPLDRNYVPDTVSFGDISVNSLIKNPLEKMVNAAENDGIILSVKYGYVSYDEQHTLYEEFVNKLLSTGKYTQVRAESLANKVICDSGNSERQLGLLVEFDTKNKSNFNQTGAYQWLCRYAANYGFVQRYTETGEQMSAMDKDYTLWRFVGKDNAQLALRLGLDFNELVEYVQSEH